MRGQRGGWFGCVVAIVSIAGCECGGEGKPDAGEPLYTAENFCSELAKRQCDFYVRCQADPTAAITDFDVVAEFGNRVPGTERARCEAALSSTQACRKIAATLAASRASINETRFTACLDVAWPTDYCARDAIAAVAACRNLQFLEPATDDGAACTFDRDCRSGFCNGAGVDSCGTCAPPGGDGTACTRDAMCIATTHYCPGADGEAGTCTRFTALGQTCDAQDLNQEECGAGNVCAVGATITSGARCAVGRKEGDLCDLSTQLPRLQCARSGRGVFELICASAANGNRCVRTQSLPGGRCGTGEISVAGFTPPLCPETQYCNAQTCVDRLAAGATCTDDAQCAIGHRCVDPAGGSATVCTALSDVGGPCASDAECLALLACDATSNTCQPRLALQSEACDPVRTCAAGSCQSAACAPLGDNGATCSAASDCASGVCSTTCQAACWQG